MKSSVHENPTAHQTLLMSVKQWTKFGQIWSADSHKKLRWVCLFQSYVFLLDFNFKSVICFSPFQHPTDETGRCLYLWWQIKQSAEIGPDVSVWIVLAIATATVKIHTYFVFYWDILMLGEANWRREICKNCRFYVRWKTFELSGPNWFWFGHLSLPTVNPPVSQWVRETGLPVYKKLLKLVDKMIWPKSSDIVIMSFFVCSICEQWRSACRRCLCSHAAFPESAAVQPAGAA